MLRIMKRSAVCLAVMLAGCRFGAADAKPSIEFTAVPVAEEGGSDRTGAIAGRVRGARPGQQIVLFARSGVWWVQPFDARPYTAIESNDTWHSTIHLGTEYAALLVQAGYRPPSTTETLPQPGGAIVAVSTTSGTGGFATRVRKTLTFSGYEWEVRQTPSDRGGANDYDPANAWVDEQGALHLKIAQHGDKWTSAEVSLRRPLGYGTYVFVVRDVALLDDAAALGLFTWDDHGAEQNHRELDIEISRWGDPAINNAQFVVQPYYMAANVARFVAPAGRLTHAFRWEPGRATFTSVAGAAAATPRTLVARHEFTSGVPTPGEETVHMNLYYFRYSRTALQREAEVVIEKFQYLP